MIIMAIGFDYDDEAKKVRDYLNENSKLVIATQDKILEYLNNLIVKSEAKTTVINTKTKYKLLLLEIESNLILYVCNGWSDGFEDDKDILEFNSKKILYKIANVKYNEFFNLNK